MPTLAEDLLVLLLDADSGRPRTDTTRLDLALAGALLLELSLDGRVDVADGGRRAHAVVLDDRATDDELLDEALQLVGSRSRRPADLVARLRKGLRPRRDPDIGDVASAAGPVQTGSYGQRQIHALRFRVEG